MGVSIEDGHFVNTRNQRIVTTLYTPPSGVEWKGVMVCHHGLGDHSKRYQEGHEIFAESGFASWSFDVHGHGTSEPTDDSERFTIKRFEHLLEDFEQLMSHVVEPWRAKTQPSLPIFFFGASMGGLVLMHVLGRGKTLQPRGVILSCTAAGVTRTPLMRVQEPFAAILNRLVPNAKLLPFKPPEAICVSEEAAQRMRDDPLLNKSDVKVCTACSLLAGLNGLPKALPSITCSVLMIHGELDDMCPHSHARACLEKMASPDRTWVLLSKAKHNLQQDTCTKEWQRSVLDWLNEQIAAGDGGDAAVATGGLPPVREIKI